MSVRTGVDEYNQPISDINSGYIGEFKYFGFSDVPPHCLACDGSEISRETYSELFKVFGETYGAGDGETTFNLPDFRGAFLRCVGGNAAALGVEQGDAIRDITGDFAIRSAGLPDTNPVGWPLQQPHGVFGAAYDNLSIQVLPLASGDGSERRGLQVQPFASSNVVPTAAENRPINYAVNICVVYE